MKSYQTIVIGFGKAGKTLAAKLAKSQSVLLVEQSPKMYGGTCINVGCIPSKRLVGEASLAPKNDFESQTQHYAQSIAGKEALVQALRKANYDKMLGAGVEVLDGTARFLDAHHIAVALPSGEEEQFHFENCIINTGSVPRLPELDGLAGNPFALDSEGLMALATLPKRLIIIGAGYIALEFASMYAGLGSEVHILQKGEPFLPREDRDMAEALAQALLSQGVHLHKNVDVQSLAQGTVHYQQEGENKSLNGDAILLATGRVPNVEALALDKAGIALNPRGGIACDESLRTSQPHIWAVGDVRGAEQFTYISLDDSRIVLDAMQGKQGRTTENRGASVYAVFTNPPFAHVGLHEEEAKKLGLRFRVHTLKAEAIPKAKVLKQTQGLLKALIEEGTGHILGATLFCAESHEIINHIKLAIDNNIPYTALRDAIYTHPTMIESFNDLFA